MKILIGIQNVVHLEYIKDFLKKFLGSEFEIFLAVDPNFLINNSLSETATWINNSYRLNSKRVFTLHKISIFSEKIRDSLSCLIYLNEKKIEWGYFYRHMNRCSLKLGYKIGLILLAFTPIPIRILLSHRLTRYLRNIYLKSGIVNIEINEIKPDIIFIMPGNMYNSYESQLIADAKLSNIPVVVQTLSWDNLNSKGTVIGIPDMYLAWNRLHRELLIHRHLIPDRNIAVTGSIFFQRYTNNSNFYSKEEVCQALGIPMKLKLIVYLGSSKNVVKKENLLLKNLLDSSSLFLKNYFLIIRPHPANFRVWNSWKYPRTLIWPRFQKLNSRSTLETESIFKSSIGAIGVNTSGFLDAIACDTPIFLIKTPAAEYQDNTSHFNDLIKVGINSFSSIDEILNEIDSSHFSIKQANLLSGYLPFKDSASMLTYDVIMRLVKNGENDGK